MLSSTCGGGENYISGTSFLLDWKKLAFDSITRRWLSELPYISMKILDCSSLSSDRRQSVPIKIVLLYTA